MATVRREQSIEFTCIGTCEDPPTWMVEGRFNAEGEFEPIEEDDARCPECGDDAEPTDEDVRLADS